MRVLMVHSFLHERGGDTTCLRIQTRLLEAAGHAVAPLATRSRRWTVFSRAAAAPGSRPPLQRRRTASK